MYTRAKCEKQSAQQCAKGAKYAQSILNVCAKFTKCMRKIYKMYAQNTQLCAQSGLIIHIVKFRTIGHVVPRDRISVCDAA